MSFTAQTQFSDEFEHCKLPKTQYLYQSFCPKKKNISRKYFFFKQDFMGQSIDAPL